MLRDRLPALPGRRGEAEAFAALLEEGPRAAAARTAGPELRELGTLATALLPTQVTPSPQFRAALRERLLAEAVPAPAVGSRGRTADARRRPVRRGRRRLVAGTAAGLLAVGVGGAWASTGALPGDPLYPVKRGLEQVQLDLATSDAARGQRHLAQADHRLAEVEALLAGERADDPATAGQVVEGLTALRAADAAGGRLLLADFDRTGDPEDLRALQRALVDQRERLRDLEPRLPAAAGPAYDALLRQLGDTTTGLLQRLDRCAAACQDLSQTLSKGLAPSGLVTVGPDGTLRPVGAAGLPGTTSSGPSGAAPGAGAPLAGPAALPVPTALPTLGGGGAAPLPSPTSSGSGGGGGAVGAVGGTLTGAGSTVGGTVSGVTGAVGGALDSTVGGSLGSTVSGAGSTVGGTVDSTVDSTAGGVTSTVGGLLGSTSSPSPSAGATPTPTSSSSPTASTSASPTPSPSPTCLVVLGVQVCS
ncbi:MAG TPA: DUF5667 domain-containing protein [Motilibacteraceae bacterium]|nr:DUF5667 domain-containing protein [Motilibacteraceae bacterium]